MVPPNPESPLLVIGAGSLGKAVLAELSRSSYAGRVVATSREPGKLQRHLNLLRVRGAVEGRESRLEAVRFDLEDPESCCETISRLAPGIIVMTATRLTWWLPQLLPARIRENLGRAGYGPWLPVHLDLTQRLMRILRESGFPGVVLTASYPDVVNSVLGCQGLAPTAGFGNVEEVVARLRLAAARHFSTVPARVEIRMAAHHALEACLSGRGSTKLPPHAVEISIAGGKILDPELSHRLLTAPLDLPSGPSTHALTAACASRVIGSILNDRGELVHVPGPAGLPGGYPVRFKGGEPRVELFGGLDLEQMVEINRASHLFDGIDSIQPDGTVVFSEPGVEVMERLLGYRCRRLEPGSVRERAGELIERFAAFARDYGVDLEKVLATRGA